LARLLKEQIFQDEELTYNFERQLVAEELWLNGSACLSPFCFEVDVAAVIYLAFITS